MRSPTQIPARIPTCPEGGCICPGSGFTLKTAAVNKVRSLLCFACPLLTIVTSLVFLWLDYMNGFRCQVTGSTSNVSLAPAKVPRRCGADPQRGVVDTTPGNCTCGAKQPFYWFQWERNNVCFSPRLTFGVVSLILFLFTVDIRRHLFSALLLGPLQL